MIYWRHPTLPGIKIEEISKDEDSTSSGRVWLEMAYQVYCENGKEDYRDIGHYHSGAPFLYGEPTRISITHCPGFLAIATLAPTPDADFSEFSPQTALGIDAEKANRAQVMKIRSRFMNAEELKLVPAGDVMRNVQAWTMKEAAYKAALTEGLDFREALIIEKLPELGPATSVYDKKEFNPDCDGSGFKPANYGRMRILFPDGREETLLTYSYLSDEYLVTLAFSEASATWK